MLNDVRGVVAPIAALPVPPSSREAGYPAGSTRVQPAAGLVAYAARAFRAATA
jgi:hypothetical protein